MIEQSQLMRQIENTPSLPEHKLILVDRLEDCFDCLEEFDVFKGCMSLRLLRERIGVVRKDLEMCVVLGDRS